MHLKLAESEDVPFILGAAKQTHKDFGGMDFDEGVTLDTIDSFINSSLDESMLIVSFNDDKYTGVIAGMLSITPFSVKKVALEPLFWTDGSYKAFKSLHEAFTTWADTVSADVTLLSAPPTREFTKWEKFYKRLGYKPYEYTFIKEGKE